MPGILVLLSLFVATQAGDTCGEEYVEPSDPLTAKPGTYIIAGMFDVGKPEMSEVEFEGGKRALARICNRNSVALWGLQKALVMRKIIWNQEERFRELNVTLGYRIYDTCGDTAIASQVAIDIAHNENVIGAAGVDRQRLVKRTAGITNSVRIPTFSYIYSDESMLEEDPFPSTFSMIDTAETRAKVIISILKKLGYVYMDIWYHDFSKTVAEYIYENYVSKEGCGHIADTTSRTTFAGNMEAVYNKTGGDDADVQLIIHNSMGTTEAILKHMLQDLKFKNKIIILGISNGRRSSFERYRKVLDNYDTSDNTTLIFPQPKVLNTKPENFSQYVAKIWTSDEEKVDIMYQDAQTRSSSCKRESEDEGETDGLEKNPVLCKTTSWLGFIIGGTQTLLDALYDSISSGRKNTNCSMDFRKMMYNRIVDENRTKTMKIDNNYTIEAAFPGKSLKNMGFLISMYQTSSKEFHDIGESFEEDFNVTEPELLKRVVHVGTCSPTCNPGYYRLLDHRYKYLKCCWTCTRCPDNTFSTDDNADMCQPCSKNETHNIDYTGCESSKFVFIERDSMEFVTATLIILLCLILVIGLGVFIFMNEKKPLIQASVPNYLYSIILSLSLGTCSSFIPLLKPSISTCTVEYLVVAAFAVLITSSVLWKLSSVYKMYKRNPKYGGTIWVGEKIKGVDHTTITLVSLTAVLLFGVGDYFTMGGPGWTFHIDQIKAHEPKYLMCGVDTPMKGVMMAPALLVPFLYFILSLSLSFKMRKFSYNYKETLFLCAAHVIVLLCWTMFLAGYILAATYFKALMRSILLIFTCLTFLAAMFLPKMIILLVKTEQQQQEALEPFTIREEKPGPSGITITPPEGESTTIV